MKIIIAQKAGKTQSHSFIPVPLSVENMLPRQVLRGEFFLTCVKHRLLSKDDVILHVLSVKDWPRTKARRLTHDGFSHLTAAECRKVGRIMDATFGFIEIRLPSKT